MGNTYLAANYVFPCQKDYSAIFWVNAASVNTLIRLDFTNTMQRLIDSFTQIPDNSTPAQILSGPFLDDAQIPGDPSPNYAQIGRLLEALL